MRLTRELVYDAPPEQVRAMLIEPEFWDRVATATDAISSTTTVTGDPAGDPVVTTHEEQQVAGVPSFAKKFVGDSTSVIKTLSWHGEEADLDIATPGKPTTLKGTLRLAASGSGTALTYDLDAKASVPLIGGKLEKLVGELTDAGFTKEHAVGQSWLRGER